MHVIILAGGAGTRLKSTFPDPPKVLAPIAGRPILQWQLEFLAEQGLTSIHISAGYKADQIDAWVQDYPMGTWVQVHTEPEPLGTAGGIRFTAQDLPTSHVLVINGDTLIPNLKIFEMIKAWDIAEVDALIAAVTLPSPDRYGCLEVDANNRITAFKEKEPRPEGTVNAGAYILSKALIDEIAPDTFVSLENDVFPSLCTAGRIAAYPCEGPMLDMGTPEGWQATEDWAGSRG